MKESFPVERFLHPWRRQKMDRSRKVYSTEGPCNLGEMLLHKAGSFCGRTYTSKEGNMNIGTSFETFLNMGPTDWRTVLYSYPRHPSPIRRSWTTRLRSEIGLFAICVFFCGQCTVKNLRTTSSFITTSLACRGSLSYPTLFKSFQKKEWTAIALR